MIAAARVPAVASRLPFLGSALELGRDPDGFFARCRSRHGDAFTVLLAGRRRTFLFDPLDYPTYFQTKELAFDEVSNELGGKVFGYDSAALRQWGIEALTHQLAVYLRGEELGNISRRMLARFGPVLARAAPLGTWRSGMLFQLIGELVFAASADALFGDGFASSAIYRHYVLIDRYFPLLALGWPARALPGVRRAQAALAEAMAVPRPDRCRLLDARAAHYEAHRVPAGQRHHMDASLVWASQANTIATAFWTLLYLLRDPTARRRVVDEVQAVAGGAAVETLAPEALRQLVTLDSAVSETMRLQSFTVLLRRVRAPVTLALRSGTRAALQPGDEICIYPRLMHLDPEIYSDPYAFRVDRFLGSDGPPIFTKAGERVLFPLLPFGGGIAICPGRFFARNEVKIVVATMLSSCDIELGTAATPDADQRRVGFGMLPPQRDAPFRFRRRAT